MKDTLLKMAQKVSNQPLTDDDQCEVVMHLILVPNCIQINDELIWIKRQISLS